MYVCACKTLQLCPTLCDPMDMCVHAKSLQSYPTPSDPMNHSLPGSSVWDSPGKNTGVVLCPPPRNLPDPGSEPTSLMSPTLVGRFFITSTTWEAPDT